MSNDTDSRTEVSSDKTACPLCGDDNSCAPARDAQAKKCWCFEVDFNPGQLERIPEHLKNKVCLCQACATAQPVPDIAK